MSSIVADTLKLLIGLKPDEASFQKVTERITGLSNKLATLGKAGGFLYFVKKLDDVTQKIIDATEATSRWSVEMQRLAKKAGVSSEVMQKLSILEEQKGLERGSISSILKHIAMVQSRTGHMRGLDEAFMRWGVNLKGDPAQVFERMIDVAKRMSPSSQRLFAEETGFDLSLLELQGADIGNISKNMVFDPDQEKRFDEMNQKFGVFNSQWRTFKDKLVLLTMPLVDKLLELANTLLTKLLDQLDEILHDEEKMAMVQKILTSVVVIVGYIVLKLLPLLLSGLKLVLKLLTKIFGFEMLKSGTKKAKEAEKVVKGFPKLIEKISKAFKKIDFTNLSIKLWGALQRCKIFLTGFFSSFFKFVIGWGGRILSGIAGAFSTVTGWLVAGFALLGALIIDGVTYFFTGEAKITRLLTGAVKKLFPGASKAMDMVVTIIENGIQDTIEDLGEIKNWCLGAYEWVKTLVTDLWGFIKEKIANTWEDLKSLGSFFNFFDKDDEKELKIKASEKGLTPQDMVENQKYNMMHALMPAVLPLKKYQSQGDTNNNVTVNNTNNFVMDNLDNPDKYATAVTQHLADNAFTRGLNASAILYGNGGK